MRFGLAGFRGAFAGVIVPYAIACVLLFLAWLASFVGAWFALLPALMFVVILVVHVPSTLLIPASCACERTDAIDAVQRSYAYLLTKPLRALAYGRFSSAIRVGVEPSRAETRQRSLSRDPSRSWSNSTLRPSHDQPMF